MNSVESLEIEESAGIAILPAIAAVVALIGLGDAIYLTVHHFTAEPVPCDITGGCETVLTSAYAEVGGVPIAAFGAIAYFTAFSLALLAAFGNRTTWTLFGVQAAIMAAFSGWLLYLQAYVIGAFCQFCLISAATSITLLIVFAASKLLKKA
jgi:uncharacterized membrane protein